MQTKRILFGLGDRIRDCYEKSPYNQTEIAEKIGVERKALNSYMNGRSQPNALGIARMAVLFNVSADWLLGLTSDPIRKE